MTILNHFERLRLHTLKYAGPGLNRVEEARYQELLEELMQDGHYSYLPSGTGGDSGAEEPGEAEQHEVGVRGDGEAGGEDEDG